jgi:hypothetical protein
MHESITKTTQHFSARASLAAIGIKLKQVDLFSPVRQMVHIAQKTVKHTPIDKVYDGFIAILAGAHGLVEINTRLRIDAGGGSLDDVNWALARGYQVHGKDYSGRHARSLAESVVEWVDDPRVPGRQVGWVTEPPTAYVREVRRIAVRCRKQNGQWAVGVLISSLSAGAILPLVGQSVSKGNEQEAILLAYVAFYDQRGGGIETSFKGDKQGLGLTKRNKKRFEAQQMVMLLGSLAHNVVVWARQWLTAPQPTQAPQMPAPTSAPLQHYGIVRMVRDVFHISGFLVMDAMGQMVQIVLNQAAPLAPLLVDPLRALLAPAHVAINLGQT